MEQLTRNILKHTLPLRKLLLKDITYGSSRSQMLFKISQYSQENTCVKVSFFAINIQK